MKRGDVIYEIIDNDMVPLPYYGNGKKNTITSLTLFSFMFFSYDYGIHINNDNVYGTMMSYLLR